MRQQMKAVFGREDLSFSDLQQALDSLIEHMGTDAAEVGVGFCACAPRGLLQEHVKGLRHKNHKGLSHIDFESNTLTYEPAESEIST